MSANAKDVLQVLLSGKFVFETREETRDRLKGKGKEYNKLYQRVKRTFFNKDEGYLFYSLRLTYALQAEDPMRYTLKDTAKIIAMSAEVALGAFFAFKAGRQMYASSVLKHDGNNPITSSVPIAKKYVKGYKDVLQPDGSVIQKPIYGVK